MKVLVLFFYISFFLPREYDDYTRIPSYGFIVRGYEGPKYTGILLDYENLYLPLYPEFNLDIAHGEFSLLRDTLEGYKPRTLLFSRKGGYDYSEVGGSFITRIGVKELEFAGYYAGERNYFSHTFELVELRYLKTPEFRVFYMKPGRAPAWGVSLKNRWVKLFAGEGVRKKLHISLTPWRFSVNADIEDSLYTINVKYGPVEAGVQKLSREFTPFASLKFSLSSISAGIEYSRRFFRDRLERGIKSYLNVNFKRCFLDLLYKQGDRVFIRTSYNEIIKATSSLDILGGFRWEPFNIVDITVEGGYNSVIQEFEGVAAIEKTFGFKNDEIIINPGLYGFYNSQWISLEFRLNLLLFKAMEIQYVQYADDYRFAIGAQLID